MTTELTPLILTAFSGGVVALLLTLFGGGGSVLAVPLTPRIFVPPSSGTPNTPDMPGVPEPSTWVQLMLGFGLIGSVARVTYRRNGTQTDPEPQAS